jgi:hypothetical protein
MNSVWTDRNIVVWRKKRHGRGVLRLKCSYVLYWKRIWETVDVCYKCIGLPCMMAVLFPSSIGSSTFKLRIECIFSILVCFLNAQRETIRIMFCALNLRGGSCHNLWRTQFPELVSSCIQCSYTWLGNVSPLWWWRHYARLKRRITFTRLHGAIFQKTSHLHSHRRENLKFHKELHSLYASPNIIGRSNRG